MARPIGEFLLYETEDGKTRVERRFAEEPLWLSQALRADLYQTTPQSITLHLKALYAEGEIDPATTCKPCLQVRTERGRQVKRELNLPRRKATAKALPYTANKPSPRGRK